MIYSVKGKVTYIDENTIAVDGGTVAFEVICSTNTIHKAMSQPNQIQTILTYLQVKEDGMCLFGFWDADERNLFMQLISVSGIGPKMAILILSNGTVASIIEAVHSGDTKLLSSIKGLGKKTAERLCLELKDKVDALAGENNLITGLGLSRAKTPEIDDAIEVLISLGLTRADAVRLTSLYADASMTAEQVVAACLKGMGR